MKVRKRARLLKRHLTSRVQVYDTEEKLFAAVREHRRRILLTQHEREFLREAAELHHYLTGEEEEAFLSSMYARAQRLAREAERTLPPPRFRKFGRQSSEV